MPDCTVLYAALYCPLQQTLLLQNSTNFMDKSKHSISLSNALFNASSAALILPFDPHKTFLQDVYNKHRFARRIHQA